MIIMEQIDLLTVFVAALVAMILSSLWYSQYAFGLVWRRITGLDKKTIKQHMKTMPLFFLLLVIISYFLSLIEIYLGVTSFWDGIIAGVVVWFGFVFTTGFSTVLWGRKNLHLFMIDSGSWCLVFMAMGGILAG